MEIGAHKVSGRLHVRLQLDKIMNQTLIEQVYVSNDEEMMHEERTEGGFK